MLSSFVTYPNDVDIPDMRYAINHHWLETQNVTFNQQNGSICFTKNYSFGDVKESRPKEGMEFYGKKRIKMLVYMSIAGLLLITPMCCIVVSIISFSIIYSFHKYEN